MPRDWIDAMIFYFILFYFIRYYDSKKRMSILRMLVCVNCKRESVFVCECVCVCVCVCIL